MAILIRYVVGKLTVRKASANAHAVIMYDHLMGICNVIKTIDQIPLKSGTTLLCAFD